MGEIANLKKLGKRMASQQGPGRILPAERAVERLALLEKVLPVINYEKLNYTIYDVFLKCSAAGEEKKQLELFLQAHKNIIWAAAVFGPYDYYFEMICRNPAEFDEKMREVISLLGDSFRDYKTVFSAERLKIKPLVPELSESIPAQYEFKHPKLDYEPIKLDELGKKILLELSKDGRASYFEIAQKLGTTLQTVRNRMRRMISDTTIERFMPVFGYQKMGYINYIVLLKVKYSDERSTKQLYEFLDRDKFTKLVLRIANTNELLLLVSTRHPSLFEDFVLGVKNTFPVLVQNIEFMHMLYEVKLNFFPEGLF